MTTLSQIGLAGLAVMGENLALNMAGKGFSVSVFNRTHGRVEDFLAGRGKGKPITGHYTVKDFVRSIERPRKIMMMLKAGPVVDDFIEQLLPFLEPDDIVIDGGNSNYKDSVRRMTYLEERQIRFVGTGVSGGEEGALKGPSIMPGGSEKAWPYLQPILTSIAAKLADGTPCCTWIGRGGAGHFVKMVHNGIEYGDMQLICESYHLMKDLLAMGPDEIHGVFARWNKGRLSSYLIEITAEIMAYKENDDASLIDIILDTAGQKGTGKWTVNGALDLGIPLSLISESVFARCLSAQKNERVAASEVLSGPDSVWAGDRENLLHDLEAALYMAKIVSYTQGFNLMQAASNAHGWDLNLGDIARIWQGGCIIRSIFLDKISNAYSNHPTLPNLMLAPYFKEDISTSQKSLRRVLSKAIAHGIPQPCHASALNYYDGYRTARLPANLLQAQRDYFGAHTYERIDKNRGDFFHTDWTGEGGDTTSTPYTR
jgi:6-phosphogluconate dehydrogenase